MNNTNSNHTTEFDTESDTESDANDRRAEDLDRALASGPVACTNDRGTLTWTPAGANADPAALVFGGVLDITDAQHQELAHQYAYAPDRVIIAAGEQYTFTPERDTLPDLVAAMALTGGARFVLNDAGWAILRAAPGHASFFEGVITPDNAPDWATFVDRGESPGVDQVDDSEDNTGGAAPAGGQ